MTIKILDEDVVYFGSALSDDPLVAGMRISERLLFGTATAGVPTINVLLSGVSPLTLLNAVELNYIKAFGKCEQDSETYLDTVTLDGKCEQDLTPTPASPVDIVCNNGAIKVKDDELPVGYKRLLDIYFDGDSYFETGEKLNGSDVVTMTLQADSSAGQNVFGAYSGTGASTINLSLYVYATTSSQSYFRANKTLLRPVLGSGKRTISFGNGSTSGFYKDVTYDIEEFETTDTAQIGALPHSSSPKFAGYLYGNITIGNRLKYIPCERASDSAIGYYETVNGEFLENQGEGTLTTSGYDTSHLNEIYYDGTVETVQAHGKNLFDVNNPYKSGYAITQNGSETAVTNFSIYSLKAEPLTTYTYSCNYAESVTTRIHSYDKNGDWIQQDTYGNANATKTFTTTSNTAEIRISINNTAALSAQLELGSTATTYQPYFEGTTATCQPLLSVGTYKDSQNITNGAVTRNVGIKVFDGITSGCKATAVNVNQEKYYAVCGGQTNITATTTDLLSTHFNAGAFASGYDIVYSVATNIVLVSSDQSLTTVELYNQWLASQYAAGTPVIVVYPLATPTTETVTGQTLTITQGTNVVTAEGSVSDLELEISYKGYAEVTVEEIEAVNTDENVEVTIS